ncbi:unnamed protein product [Rhizoctonia solani]|uniref:Uncharacterized protein n=1 Tax=Rhizoctonia solani TaxID=456999 RepID=A0A8H3BES6_9AGAM|nr:unnamed protein product [Rhizoctonia solani]
MPNLKRKKGAADCLEAESSSGKAERPPEPLKSKQQLSILDIKWTHVPLTAQTTMPSRAQSQFMTKPLAMPAACQLSSKANPKSKVPPTPLDTPDPKASSLRDSRQTTVVNSSNESLPDSCVISMLQKADKHMALSSDDKHPLPVATVATHGLIQLEHNPDSICTDFNSLGTHIGGQINKLESKLNTLLALQLKQVHSSIDIGLAGLWSSLVRQFC